MKLIGTLSTAVLSLTLGSLTLGVALPAYAQEQHDQQEDKDKPAQEKEKKVQPEKPARPEDKNAKQDENRKPEEKAQEHAQPKPEEHAQPKPEEHAQSKPEEHAHAGRIPDDRFKANFGREHSFRVSQSDYQSHRFQYGGYWFGFESAWPSNWLYTQNVYVVEIDGVYYLCNASYPGVNLTLSVTL
jgi:hypothetical protein